MSKTVDPSAQKMILGDARRVVPRYPNGSFDVIMTDPPYGIPMNWDGVVDWHLNDADMDQTLALTRWLMHEAARVLAEDGWLYVTCEDTILVEAITEARAAGFNVRTFGWVKPSAQFAVWGPWKSAFQPCVIGYRRNSRKDFEGKLTGLNWMSAMPEQGRSRRRHPTQKPLALFEYWLRRTPGRVLDPFAGSGTALVAAKRLSLPAVGVEINPDYVAWARERLGNTPLGEGLEE